MALELPRFWGRFTARPATIATIRGRRSREERGSERVGSGLLNSLFQSGENFIMVDVAQGRWPRNMQRAAQESSREAGTIETMTDSVVHSVEDFVHEHPETAVLWAFGLGFVLGWSLRLW